MQKCDKEASIIGVEDLERWPIESAAVGFLSVSGTAASLETLKEVSPSRACWQLANRY
jgi:hypothetical protein